MERSGRRHHVAAGVKAKFDQLYDQGFTPKQIHEIIQEDPKLAPKSPSLRTLQRMAQARASAAGRPDSEWWMIQPADEPDPLVAFQLQQVALRVSEGKTPKITIEEGRWATIVSRLKPQLLDHPHRMWGLYLIARAYVEMRGEGKPTSGLDAFLEYEPWEKTDSVSYWPRGGFAYVRDVLRLKIPPAPWSISSALVGFVGGVGACASADSDGLCEVYWGAPPEAVRRFGLEDDEDNPLDFEPDQSGDLYGRRTLKQPSDAERYLRFLEENRVPRTGGE
jgi:hypothetical protein